MRRDSTSQLVGQVNLLLDIKSIFKILLELDRERKYLFLFYFNQNYWSFSYTNPERGIYHIHASHPSSQPVWFILGLFYWQVDQEVSEKQLIHTNQPVQITQPYWPSVKLLKYRTTTWTFILNFAILTVPVHTVSSYIEIVESALKTFNRARSAGIVLPSALVSLWSGFSPPGNLLGCRVPRRLILGRSPED